MSTVGLDNILQNQAAQSASTSASKTANAAQTEKNMFLTLLCKQLQYQDPLNPVENTEFATQLAQFSSLEALSNMRSSIETMTSYQNSMNSMQAISFIGKTVTASGNTISYNGSPSTINYNLDANAATVKVRIYNSSGSLVRTMEINDALKGDQTCTWDGKNDYGTAVSSGSYYFNVSATDYNGNSVTTTTKTNGTITGLKYDNGVIYLEVGDKVITLSEIQKISN
jgi:flagellar basal-body rod modification protein FlgD